MYLPNPWKNTDLLKLIRLKLATTTLLVFTFITPSNKLINPTSLTPQTTVLSEPIVYKLAVENDNGCQGSATSIVKVFTQLYMPSAFTPNDDGLNDQFRIPPSSAITLKEFSIYNRWGTLVLSLIHI